MPGFQNESLYSGLYFIHKADYTAARLNLKAKKINAPPMFPYIASKTLDIKWFSS